MPSPCSPAGFARATPWGVSGGAAEAHPELLGVAPDLLGRPDDQLELRALGIRRDLVPLEGRGEAALGGERQPLQRDVLGRGVDAAPQLVLALEIRPLGGDQPEDDRDVAGDEAQRGKVARTIIVVLQQQAVMFETGKETFGDPS